jgi:hypothetical protein
MAEAFGRGPGGGGSSAFAPSVFPPEALAFAQKNRAFIISLEAALDAFVEVRLPSLPRSHVVNASESPPFNIPRAFIILLEVALARRIRGGAVAANECYALNASVHRLILCPLCILLPISPPIGWRIRTTPDLCSRAGWPTGHPPPILF